MMGAGVVAVLLASNTIKNLSMRYYNMQIPKIYSNNYNILNKTTIMFDMATKCS